MYIMKCDRCGKEKKIKSLLPIFGVKEDPQPGRKYSITTLGEFREITLCQECEAALERWIEDYTCEAKSRCDNCKHKDCWEYDDPCDSCANPLTGERTKWEPQTRADSIRAMMDEELAELIASRGGCPSGRYPDDHDCKSDCNECWLDWLKQEAHDEP